MLSSTKKGIGGVGAYLNKNNRTKVEKYVKKNISENQTPVDVEATEELKREKLRSMMTAVEGSLIHFIAYSPVDPFDFIVDRLNAGYTKTQVYTSVYHHESL